MTPCRLTYTLALLMVLGAALRADAAAKAYRNADTGAQFHGIDVSHHQGKIDWATVATDKRVGFVYIRASNGTKGDSNYHNNLAAAKRQGIAVGSYHFLNPNSPVQAQFKNFSNRVKRGEQDLIPVIDIEDVPELGVLWKPQQARDFLAEFAELVRKHYGVTPMIYTSNKFFTDYLGRAFAGLPLFIARYGTLEPNPLNGAQWTLWQFTKHGRLDGINHMVDLSRFNHGFGIANIRMPGVAKAKKHHKKSSKATTVEGTKKGHHKKKDRTSQRTSKDAKKSVKAKTSDDSKNQERTSPKKNRTSSKKSKDVTKSKKHQKTEAKKSSDKPKSIAKKEKTLKTKKNDKSKRK